MSGWISLHRKIQDNKLWKEPRVFSKAEAWIDILMEVQHSEKRNEIVIKNTTITCDRGQSIKSIQTWAERWTWSKSAVQRFLKWLKREKMITLENLKKTTRLSVCKYETYQKKRIASESQVNRKRIASESQVNTDNKVNNDNNDNNDNNKQLFDEARKIFKGRKNGLEPEYTNFKKKFPNYKDVIPLLKPAIENQIVWRKEDNCFWKTFQTWINNSCWTEEKESYERNNRKTAPTGERKPKDEAYTGPSAFGVTVDGST